MPFTHFSQIEKGEEEKKKKNRSSSAGSASAVKVPDDADASANGGALDLGTECRGGELNLCSVYLLTAAAAIKKLPDQQTCRAETAS